MSQPLTLVRRVFFSHLEGISVFVFPRIPGEGNTHSGHVYQTAAPRPLAGSRLNYLDLGQGLCTHATVVPNPDSTYHQQPARGLHLPALHREGALLRGRLPSPRGGTAASDPDTHRPPVVPPQWPRSHSVHQKPSPISPGPGRGKAIHASQGSLLSTQAVVFRAGASCPVRSLSQKAGLPCFR